eukprot:CAMPEP_0114612154 /NCGR_PEP_ID=MMETSP0168-20121206/4478_1 /TAXON_ID=95228 ORGANISM="Vannella sp., Strain DIVA3 517/6/12" /NCGR_SAMPLE_ID=MMETSP0168 /ASSEMBLY_ACC=CAM_ASM_000044 /LENGTH=320 /DNA_ID=CAMNT_0001823135 /DNA_START=45 /DNA_END=1007 /DNA_ORIENTATION=-
MSNKLEGSTDQERFSSLCQKTHKEQVVWFLNAYWAEHQNDASKLWDWCHKAVELDLQNHENGNGLDELNAHRLLEHFDETMTVREMRESLRSTGAISASARPKVDPITHVLVFKYKADWKELINRTQGDNREEMEEAQRMLDSVVAAFKEAEARAQEARQREAEAREAEAPFKAAQEEVEAALAEVHREEAEYNGKIDDCKARSESGGVVSRNKAKNELAQLLAEDPLPLRKAKITLEAAQKRAEKARAPFEAKTKAAVEARTAADAAAQEAADQVAAAEAYLDEVRSRPGQPYGSLWWIDRELHEQKKYLPESKGGIRR